jgi:uncharacterized peroxidase-related enzyme
MRLQVLERGHRWPARAFQRVAAMVFRAEMDDVAKTAMHRPGFWGRPFFTYGGEVLRGPSFWTAGEREYMAMFTSRLNDCPYCARVHTATAALESRGEIDVADPSSARPELTAVLRLLEKVTRSPDDVTPEDVDAVRAAGVPDEAIVDALHVNAVFNVVNRLANAFDWAWDSDRHVQASARAIHMFRYQLPGFVMR